MQIEELYKGGYLTKSQIDLKLAGITQYSKLLMEYDPKVKMVIENHNPQFLNLNVYLIDV